MTVTAPSMHNWTELLSSVDSNKGVFRASMETLRMLEGRQRAGKHIRSAIQEKLASMGLGHLPEELPNRQQQEVLLYRLGTPASDLVQAIKKSLEEPSPPEAAYTLLHRLNSIPDPDAVVHRDQVDATVDREVGEAIQKTAESVLEMLSKAHPGSTPADGQAPVQNPDLMRMMATLREVEPAPDAEFSDR